MYYGDILISEITNCQFECLVIISDTKNTTTKKVEEPKFIVSDTPCTLPPNNNCKFGRGPAEFYISK